MNAKLKVAAVLCACLTLPPASAAAQTRRAHAHAETPIAALAAANDASRQRPSRARFDHARQVYTYESGAIYELYTNPSYVSTILLEPGESLVNIAAGDTSRWMVTQAEGDDAGRTIVLIKPQTTNLRTNVVLITDRRTYLVEAVSQTGSTYSAQVAWSYPQDESPAAPSIASLNFDYRIRAIRGRTPAWTPARVYDDGRRTWIEFSPDIVASDLPPLFIITADGAELVNYRVQAGAPGQRYMLDRVFDVAELRLGTRAQTIVRIERHPQVPTTNVRHGPRG